MNDKLTKLRQPLTKDDILLNCSKYENQCISILLYKSVRIDQQRLDEAFGIDWQLLFEDKDGSSTCSISVYNEDLKEWVTREDVSDEGRTAKQRATDSLRRAGFRFGIGCELRNAPMLKIFRLVRDKNGTVISRFDDDFNGAWKFLQECYITEYNSNNEEINIKISHPDYDDIIDTSKEGISQKEMCVMLSEFKNQQKAISQQQTNSTLVDIMVQEDIDKLIQKIKDTNVYKAYEEFSKIYKSCLLIEKLEEVVINMVDGINDAEKLSEFYKIHYIKNCPAEFNDRMIEYCKKRKAELTREVH